MGPSKLESNRYSQASKTLSLHLSPVTVSLLYVGGR